MVPRILLLAFCAVLANGCARDRLRGSPLRLDSPRATYGEFRNACAHDEDLPRAYACLSVPAQGACDYGSEFKPALTKTAAGLLFRKLMGEAQFVTEYVEKERHAALVQIMIRDSGETFDLQFERIPPDPAADPGVLPAEGWRVNVDFARLFPRIEKLVRPEEMAPEEIRRLQERFRESRLNSPSTSRRHP